MQNKHHLLVTALMSVTALPMMSCGGAATQPPTATRPAATAPAASATAAVPTPRKRTYALKLPDRWTRADGDGFETISGPDAVTIHIWETSSDELRAAIDGGWKKIAPDMSLKERSSRKGAPNERFSEELVVTYTDDANENVAQGVALRHVADKSRVYVLLVRGELKAVQKRGAELNQILSSLEVEGAAKLSVKAGDVKPFDAARQKLFFDFVEEARLVADVPGVTVAVVTPEGVFTKGFGQTSAAKGKPVGPDTQFMIGSITKSFSTLLLGTLVDDGKLSWDTPAVTAYPKFAMAEGRGAQVKMRHLFCACVGAPRQDMELLFNFEKKTAQDVFAEVKTMKLTTGFGETFQYNNQLTAAGGYIAGLVAGGGEPSKAYASALNKRVLTPIGMKDTTLSENAVRSRGDHALPHHLDWSGDNAALALELERFVRPYAPAGALWSTANDMAKYIQLQLARGKNAAGETVVSEPNLTATQTGQVKVSDDVSYGMGWLVGKYRGLEVLSHSGGTMGFNSDLVIFPELGMGMFISANRSPAMVSGAVRARLLEVLFDLPPKTKDKLAHEQKQLRKSMAESRAKLVQTPVPDAFFGRYESVELGVVNVRKKGAKAELAAGSWSAGLGVIDPAERKDALMLTSGVLQGAVLFSEVRDGKPVLVLKHSQSDYVFRKR